MSANFYGERIDDFILALFYPDNVRMVGLWKGQSLCGALGPGFRWNDDLWNNLAGCGRKT